MTSEIERTGTGKQRTEMHGEGGACKKRDGQIGILESNDFKFFIEYYIVIETNCDRTKHDID